MVCIAQQEKLESYAFDNEFSAPFTTARTSHAVVPSENLNLIFQNLYHETSLDKDQVASSWKQYREQIKTLLAVRLSDYFQIGVQSMKSGPLKGQKSEIVDVNAHLAPKSSSDNLNARGYGVELRVKLD